MTDEKQDSSSRNAPNTTGVERILNLPSIQNAVSQENQQQAIQGYLKELKAIEAEHFAQIRQAALEKALLERLENSTYWSIAKETIYAINPSVGYLVDLRFTPQHTLMSATIKIRKTGKQDRHVTPVTLIERLIDSALFVGAPVDLILHSLFLKLEAFSSILPEESRLCIQGIFDFFKHPDYQTEQGISILIKIIAHFYNENVLLKMDDGFVKIPYKTSDCYFVPTLQFSGSLYYHENEGSFIQALGKILDGFEGIAAGQEGLTSLQQKQLVYTLFATFDYLPLPENSENPKKKKCDEKKHRYVGESLNRLAEVCANHLHFIWQAYPALSLNYKKVLFEGFLNYVSQGITEKELIEVLGCENLKEVQKQVNETLKNRLGLNTIKENFTNIGRVAGFYKQYKEQYKEIETFKKELKIEVGNILESWVPDYVIELNPEKEDGLGTPDSILTKAQTENLFESYAIELLCNLFEKSMSFNQMEKYWNVLTIKDPETFNNIFYQALKKLLTVSFFVQRIYFILLFIAVVIFAVIAFLSTKQLYGMYTLPSCIPSFLNLNYP